MAETWQWRIDTDPELAAAMGLLSQRRSTHALDPRSLPSFAKRLQWMEAALTRVQDSSYVNREELKNDAEKLSYDLYCKQMSDYCTFTPQHKAYLCCINRLEGPQTDLALYAQYLPLKTIQDRQFYLKFLQAVPVQLQEIIELLNQGMREKRTPPNVSLEGVVPQIRGMMDAGMKSFSGPIDSCFPPEEAATEQACKDAIVKIKAAFGILADFLESDYIPSLRTDISASTGYPDGKQYYADCLAFHTTTSMTPAQVHQLGLDEVKRVRDNMEAIATQAGYENRLEDYLKHLRTDKEYEPVSGPALCAHYRDITGRIAPALLKLFHVHTLPRMPFSIVETPAAHASTAPGAYYLAGSAHPDAPRPGKFYVNTSELPTRRTYECESLALHEAIPGHHTQGSIQVESPDLPDFRRFQEDRRYFEAPCRFPFYTGYIEGWGLHSETLGHELGLYENPSDQMGQLSMEALRSCRLVVDTGMHAMGWSTEKAVQFMLENTATGEHDVRTEVSRYCTWPGQATAYKVGERFLRRLRTMAETDLGDKFDPRDFYDVVLKCGPIPLDVLERLVKEYIAATKEGRAPPGGAAKVDMGMSPDAAFLDSMSFANWCKCCVVPGTCETK